MKRVLVFLAIIAVCAFFALLFFASAPPDVGLPIAAVVAVVLIVRAAWKWSGELTK